MRGRPALSHCPEDVQATLDDPEVKVKPGSQVTVQEVPLEPPVAQDCGDKEPWIGGESTGQLMGLQTGAPTHWWLVAEAWQVTTLEEAPLIW